MKKGHMNKRFVHSFILLLVMVFAIGIVFFYSNIKFTGLAVLDEYTDEASCTAEPHSAYVWYLGKCYDAQPICSAEFLELCDEPTCTGIEKYWYNNVCNAEAAPVCDTTHLSLCLDEPTCTGIEKYWYKNVCNAEAAPVCDTTHLSLCLDEPTCTTATGYWYNSVCNAEAYVCSPVTCDSLGYSCGSANDGCGESLNCGNCSESAVCNSGICETEDASSESTDESSEVQIPVTAETVKSTSSCIPNWQCDETWGECTDGTQIRTCVDTNQCGSEEGIPATSQSCVVEIKETCDDKIKNQDETGIDCGGSVCKKCSFFTIAGSAVSGTIDVGRKFILEGMFGNITKTIISIGVLVFIIGGIVVFVLFKKKILKLSLKPSKQINLSNK